MPAIVVTGLYTGLLLFWLSFLFLSIVRLRFKYKASLGDGGQGELSRLIRIHGNFTETVPFLLLTLALLEGSSYPLWLLHSFGTLTVLGRILHYFGLRRPIKGVSKMRVTASIITNILFILGGALLIWRYVTLSLM